MTILFTVYLFFRIKDITFENTTRIQVPKTVKSKFAAFFLRISSVLRGKNIDLLSVKYGSDGLLKKVKLLVT
jgi:hypothetical protein